MTTILGPLPCATCKAPVTVVRRPVVIRSDGQACGRHDHTDCATSAKSRELREVVTIADGKDHRCGSAS